MKSLKDFNNERREVWHTSSTNEPVGNDIECPECGEELFDSNPDLTLTSYPTQKNVHCDKCHYTGYRIK